MKMIKQYEKEGKLSGIKNSVTLQVSFSHGLLGIAGGEGT
jgi:hypothetical protein